MSNRSKPHWNLTSNDWPSLPSKPAPSKLPTVKEEQPLKAEEQPLKAEEQPLKAEEQVKSRKFPFGYTLELPKGVYVLAANFAPLVLLNRPEWPACKTVGEFKILFDSFYEQYAFEIINTDELFRIEQAYGLPVTLEKMLSWQEGQHIKPRRTYRPSLFWFLNDVNFDRCLWVLTENTKCLPRIPQESFRPTENYGFLQVRNKSALGLSAPIKWLTTPELLEQWRCPEFERYGTEERSDRLLMMDCH